MVCMLLCMPASAQYDYTAQSARRGALGGCLVINPHERTLHVAYRQGFASTGTADKAVRLQLPTGPGGVALLSYNHFGNSTFYQQQALAGYALRLSKRIYMGAAARWLQTGTADAHYQSQQWLSAMLLLHVQWRYTGLTLLSTTRPWDRERAWGVAMQASYRPSAQLLTLVQLASEERWRWRAGMEYNYRETFFLRAGVVTQPLALTFGGGVRLGQYAFDFAFEAHNTLGINPQMSLCLWF